MAINTKVVVAQATTEMPTFVAPIGSTGKLLGKKAFEAWKSANPLSYELWEKLTTEPTPVESAPIATPEPTPEVEPTNETPANEPALEEESPMSENEAIVAETVEPTPTTQEKTLDEKYKEAIVAIRQEELKALELALAKKQEELAKFPTKEKLEKDLKEVSPTKGRNAELVKARGRLASAVEAKNQVTVAQAKVNKAKEALQKAEKATYEGKSQEDLDKLQAALEKLQGTFLKQPMNETHNAHQGPNIKTQAEVRQMQEEQARRIAVRDLIGRVKATVADLTELMRTPDMEVGIYQVAEDWSKDCRRAQAALHTWADMSPGSFKVEASYEDVQAATIRLLEKVVDWGTKVTTPQDAEEAVAPEAEPKMTQEPEEAVAPEAEPKMTQEQILEEVIEWGTKVTQAQETEAVVEEPKPEPKMTQEQILEEVRKLVADLKADNDRMEAQVALEKEEQASLEAMVEQQETVVVSYESENNQEPAVAPVKEEKKMKKDPIMLAEEMFGRLNLAHHMTEEEIVAYLNQVAKGEKITALGQMGLALARRVLHKGEEKAVSFLAHRRERLAKQQEQAEKAKEESVSINETKAEKAKKEETVEKQEKKTTEQVVEPADKVLFEAPKGPGLISSLMTAALAFVGLESAKREKASSEAYELLMGGFKGEVSDKPDTFLLKGGKTFRALKDIVGATLGKDATDEDKQKMEEKQAENLATVGMAATVWLLNNPKLWIKGFKKAYMATKLSVLSLEKGKETQAESLPFSREGQEVKLNHLFQMLPWLSIKQAVVGFDIGQYMTESFDYHTRALTKKEAVSVILGALRDDRLDLAKKVAIGFGMKAELLVTEKAAIAAMMQLFISELSEAQADEFTLFCGLKLEMSTKENQDALKAILDENQSWWRRALRGCVNAANTAYNKMIQLKNWIILLFKSDEKKEETVAEIKVDKTLWEKTKDTVVAVKDAVVNFFTNSWKKITGLFSKKEEKPTLEKALEKAKEEGEKPSIWTRIKNGVVNAAKAVGSFFVSCWETVTGWFKSEKKDEAAVVAPAAAV